MYSTNSERKSVVAEKFIRTLKKKIYKYITSVSKKVCINKLDNIANKYNKTYYRVIKIKSVDIKLGTYIDSSKENNEKNPLI